MATRHTVYIADRHTPLWGAAERLAARDKVSVSHVIAAALADYLPRAADRPAPADRWAHIAPNPAIDRQKVAA